MKHLRILTIAILWMLPFSWLEAAPVTAPGNKASLQAGNKEKPTGEVRHFTLQALSGQPVIALRNYDGQSQINFNVRKDELISKATLRLRYTYSPALLPTLSHIRVVLNDEVIGVAPITREGAGKEASFQVEINPRLLTDFNRLKLHLIGHYTTDCEDPLHNSLWADISGSSELEIEVQHLSLASNLAILPEPFFDRRDSNLLRLPFVFAAKPSGSTLRAAGVVSSWFGMLAEWRGARFPAYLDRLPAGDAIVFFSNKERPAFMKDFPQVTAPGLSIITNPEDGYSKLLLVTGRDEKDLYAAATTLVLGSSALSGTSATIDKALLEAPRLAYDAPKWVRLDQPVKFGELIDSPQQLQVAGLTPSLVRVSMRIPPDLFTWRSRGVAVNLKYRYTPPIRENDSRLNISVNDELVRSFTLRPSGQGGDMSRMKLPLLDDGMLSEAGEMFIPSFKLGARNELQYGFSFVTEKQGLCRSNILENTRAMIDADSTIDFSDYPHYAEMPNLGYFATMGFPFTKYADLAQTVVVLPDTPSEQTIGAFLSVLGHMGEATGYPATRFNIVTRGQEDQIKDADILLISPSTEQSMLKKWTAQMPVTLDGASVRNSQPVRRPSFLYDWLGFDTKPLTAVASQEQIRSDGSLAAMLGFESPLSSGRSVVAITASVPEAFGQMLDALDNNGQVREMHGSVVFVRGKQVDSELVGNTYTIGRLPFWTSIWYPLSKHPILIAIMAVLAIFIFAFALWRTLKAAAEARLRNSKK